MFCRGVLETLPRIDLRPDVIHAHDHAAALVPIILRRIPRGGGFLAGVRTVLTIHNLAHQGLADPDLLDRTGLGREEFHPGGDLEFWGRVVDEQGRPVSDARASLFEGGGSNSASERSAPTN